MPGSRRLGMEEGEGGFQGRERGLWEFGRRCEYSGNFGTIYA
jgi:hypothetical protein